MHKEQRNQPWNQQEETARVYQSKPPATANGPTGELNNLHNPPSNHLGFGPVMLCFSAKTEDKEPRGHQNPQMVAVNPKITTPPPRPSSSEPEPEPEPAAAAAAAVGAACNATRVVRVR